MTRPDSARITEHHDSDPGENPWVHGAPLVEHVEVGDYDPAWPTAFATIAQLIHAALGDAVLGLDHVGSTSVPGLAAKPVIDLVLTGRIETIDKYNLRKQAVVREIYRRAFESAGLL